MRSTSPLEARPHSGTLAPDAQHGVFDRINDPVICCERRGSVVYVNPAAGRIQGRTPDELLGLDVGQLFPGEPGAALRQALEGLEGTGQAVFETCHPASNRWYQHTCYLADDRVWILGKDVSSERLASARLEILTGASRAFAEASPDVDTLFDTVCRHVAEMIQDGCVIRLLSEDGQLFERPAGAWDGDPRVRRFLKGAPPMEAGDGPDGEILRTGRPVMLNGAEAQTHSERITTPDRRDLVAQLGLHSLLNVPLKAQGQTVGMLCAFRRGDRTPRPFDEADVRLLEDLASRAALVVKQWRTLHLVEKSRQRLALVGDTISAQLSLVDRDGRYQFVNKAYETWFGRDRSTIVGRTVEEILGPAAYRVAGPYVERALAGETVTFDTRFSYPVGDRDVHVTYTPQIVDGHVEGVVVLVVDQTDKVQMANEQRRSADQLRRWEQLFQHAAWGVVMADPENGRLLAANPAFASMHGYESVEELQGISIEAIVAPESLAEFPANLAIVRDKGHHQFESIHLHRDGRQFPCLTDLMEFKDDEGLVLYRAANVQDITDRKRYEAELKAAIAARDEFLSIASHELRTPLTALALQLDGLERAIGNELTHDRLADRVQTAVRQARRLTTLVNGLFNVSQLSRGVFQLEPEDFDLVALIREVAEEMAGQAKRAGCELSTRCPESAPGRWDRSRVEQALTNLLANAFNYAPGKPVVIQLDLEGESVKLSVRDEGIGISPQDQTRIFGRFERAVPSRHYGGLGLGLYVTKQIAQAHGGTVEVESEPGKGSVFTLSLPRITREPTPRTQGT